MNDHNDSMAQIAVLGSLNRDIVVHVGRIPMPGETVLASGTTTHRGGKGANQAMAAAKLGSSVAMIGKVGADAEGTGYLRALVDEGIDVAGVTVDIDRPTGHAYIALDDAGENAISVVPGANGRVGPEDVASCADQLARATVTLAQLEVPLMAVKAAAGLCGGIFILNAAPAQQLGRDLMAMVDVLVVNRAELAMLAGASQRDDAESMASQALGLEGPRAVVVTLGSAGALVVQGDDFRQAAAPRVAAVDTTGAGDAFCGALAHAMAGGEDLRSAVGWAVAAGAAATTKLGAQTGLPTPTEVASLMSG